MNYSIMIDAKRNMATIEFGKSDICGEYKKSPNGQIYMLCDILDTSNDSKEAAFVFTANEVLYKKIIPEDASVDYFEVFDDGRSLIVTDEIVLMLTADGKQVKRKKFSSIQQHGFYGSTLWIIGDNDEGDTILALFDVNTAEMKQQIIPEIEYLDEENEEYSSFVEESLFIGDKFLFIYDNEVDAVAYNLSGEKIEVDQSEVEQANLARHERQRVESIKRAENSYKYWSERLEKNKGKRTKAAEVERAAAEVEKYKEKLISLGVEIPILKDSTETTVMRKEKGVFSKLFKK